MQGNGNGGVDIPLTHKCRIMGLTESGEEVV